MEGERQPFMEHAMDEFTRGYIDGWQSLMPGSNPPGIPAYAIPAGSTEYGHGYRLGKEKAEERL